MHFHSIFGSISKGQGSLSLESKSVKLTIGKLKKTKIGLFKFVILEFGKILVTFALETTVTKKLYSLSKFFQLTAFIFFERKKLIFSPFFKDSSKIYFILFPSTFSFHFFSGEIIKFSSSTVFSSIITQRLNSTCLVQLGIFLYHKSKFAE